MCATDKETMMVAILVAALVTNKPPVVVSTGLSGVMPPVMYSTFMQRMGNSFQIIMAPPVCSKRQFEDISDRVGSDKVSLLAHSSFDVDILESHRLKRALLIDPATVPALSVKGLVASVVTTRAPTKVVLSKLYNDFVPPAFRPLITDAVYEQCVTSGHSDILDDAWIRIATMMGIPTEPDASEHYRTTVNDIVIDWLQGCDAETNAGLPASSATTGE